VRDGAVLVDGERRPKSHRLEGGEELEVELPDKTMVLEPSAEPLEVVFEDEQSLEVDAAATEKLRAELRASRTVTSLTEYFSGDLLPSTKPVSLAGNAEFGMT